MNMTNSTFISGFEPLVGLISGDAGAWTRFWAQQTDMMLPHKGARGVLNNIVAPQLHEVSNDYGSYLKNANKWLFSGSEDLKDMLDIYTGRPINYYDPMTNATNAILPMFKSNGGLEPWRQYLLGTGWDGLQKMRINPHTKQPLNSRQKKWINNWIAKNADLQTQIQALMLDDDLNGELREYREELGQRPQSDFPIKELRIHQKLDEIHDRAFKAAWNAFERTEDNHTPVGRLMQTRDLYLNKGQIKRAAEKQKRVKELLNY